jgi:hypothetical protein
MRLDSRRHARRGSVLVIYAMLFFALCGLAAVVIDLGMARLTQTEMQSAADTAAIEGLRYRDPNTGTWPTNTEPPTPSPRDITNAIFDDDLNPDNGDRFAYGAGPIIPLTGGIGPDGTASQFIAITSDDVKNPSRLVYKPQLALNEGNDPTGDVVSMRYDPSQVGSGRDENSDYSRNDGFVPASGSSTDSLLIRIRRSNESPVDGVSTFGPTLPFLFGQGSMMQKDPSSSYNPRKDGVTVRATAIAQLVPAKTAGRSSTNSRGLAPFALPKAALTSGSVVYTVGSNGVLSPSSGQVIDPTTALTIAQRIDDRAATALPSTFAAGIYYVPLYDDQLTPANVKWVVGFALLRVTDASPMAGSVTAQLLATSGGTQFPPGTPDAGKPFMNVSGAVIQQANSAIPSDIPAATLTAVFSDNKSLADPTVNSGIAGYIVLAPILVR